MKTPTSSPEATLEAITVLTQLIQRQHQESQVSLQGLNDRLVGVEEKITVIDDRLTRVEEKITVIDDRLTKVEEKITVIDDRLTKVEEKTTTIANQLIRVEEKNMAIADRIGDLATRSSSQDARLWALVITMFTVMSGILVRVLVFPNT
jgi:chromosome segregation ATPase